MKVYFIGIGGIGVSALARYYLANGHKVSGSDLVSSEITKALEKIGAEIKIGEHKAKNVPKDAEMVVYSPAVKQDNLELREVKKRGTKIQSYPEALGELTKKYFTIAVSGTHGKSTTTAMIGLLLVKAGLNPTVIVGTKVKEFCDGSTGSPQGSNFRQGGRSESAICNLKSKILVIEADEHMASFLNYWPRIIVLTNIEADHLDYYKNLNNIIKTFKRYIGHLPKEGTLVANKDDYNISKIKIQKTKLKFKIQNYFLKQTEAKELRKILKIPGEHNISNALAALAVARILKVPDKISFKSLSEYKGSWRRFDEKTIKLNAKHYTLINDYGHHPTEIRATIKAAREKYPNKKIWCVFQPHQYQRTYYLWKDFVKTLKEAPVEKLIITDIYDVAGREEKGVRGKINSRKLVEKINKSFVKYLSKQNLLEFINENIGNFDVLIIMGAGDIYNLSLQLMKRDRGCPQPIPCTIF